MSAFTAALKPHPYNNSLLNDFLYTDGTLRDVYVDKTTLEDWNNFLAATKASSYTLTYFDGDKEVDLPEQAAAIFSDKPDLKLLTIGTGKFIFNCHFFVSTQIEFDLNPVDFVASKDNKVIYDFMQFVALATKKTVRLTPEGMGQITLLAVYPNDKRIHLKTLSSLNN